jgi:hypothetical protein
MRAQMPLIAAVRTGQSVSPGVCKVTLQARLIQETAAASESTHAALECSSRTWTTASNLYHLHHERKDLQ